MLGHPFILNAYEACVSGVFVDCLDCLSACVSFSNHHRHQNV